MGEGGVPIGADLDPGYVKLQRRFNSLAKIYRGPTFGADSQDRRLQCVEAVVQWQQGMPAEREDGRLLSLGQGR